MSSNIVSGGLNYKRYPTRKECIYTIEIEFLLSFFLRQTPGPAFAHFELPNVLQWSSIGGGSSTTAEGLCGDVERDSEALDVRGRGGGVDLRREGDLGEGGDLLRVGEPDDALVRRLGGEPRVRGQLVREGGLRGVGSRGVRGGRSDQRGEEWVFLPRRWRWSRPQPLGEERS